MHHDPEKNVLWVASTIEDSRQISISTKRHPHCFSRAQKEKCSPRAATRPIPAIDTTLYVGWNAMFISAYLEAARVLRGDDCRAFALKTLDRILTEAWDEASGVLHRIGGPRLEGSLDD